MASAHMQSNFTKESPKPTSLLYVLNVDEKKGMWATYENVLSDWTKQYITDENYVDSTLTKNTISSKYGSNFTYTNKAPLKEVPTPNIDIQLDTVIGTVRQLRVCVTPNRPINRLEVFTNKVDILKADINGIELSEYYLKNRGNGKLITHYISDIVYTELNLEISSEAKLELTVYEASNDLLSNTLFTIPQRKANEMPMPFILNDAILTIQKVKFE